MIPSQGEGEHAVFQTETKISLLVSVEKAPSEAVAAQSEYFLAQIVQQIGAPWNATNSWHRLGRG
jgi:hypothetical protein